MPATEELGDKSPEAVCECEQSEEKLGSENSDVRSKAEDKSELISLIAAAERGDDVRITSNSCYGNTDVEEMFYDEEEDLELVYPEYEAPEDDSNDLENRENWQMLTSSLDMDNEDLLFNMLYFSTGDDAASSLSAPQMINNAMSETVALHSESNTPYKLRPVSEKDLQTVLVAQLSPRSLEVLRSESGQSGVQCCCCMEEILQDQKVAKLPACQHSFHSECLHKWFRMQNWCPICRTPVRADAQTATAEHTVDHVGDAPSKCTSRNSLRKPMQLPDSSNRVTCLCEDRLE